jgi:HK97 family phage major capsid protein
LRSEILKIALETSIVRPRARVIPMDSLTVPFPTIDSTSNASNVYGGISFGWAGEGESIDDTEDSVKFGQVLLRANKFTGYTTVPNELWTDSLVSLQALLDQLFPEAYGFQEDMAFFHGDGVGQPLGFLHAQNSAAISVAKQTGQAATTIVWENLVKMFSRMLPSSLGRAVWLAHIDTFPELATMALSVGTGGGPIWLTNGANGSPMSILGRPVYFTEKANTTGAVGDISFVDLGYYLIGDRMTMTAATSPHYKFANDRTALRWISRVDGRPWIKNAITPAKGSNTLSPFVKIAIRS